jgi:hypothetical protein
MYIDIWATYAPLAQEIPHLQKIEKKYEGKKIAFVSISVDTKMIMKNGSPLLLLNSSAAFNYLQMIGTLILS